MCGIITLINSPTASIPSRVAELLHNQYTRGIDGAGYTLIFRGHESHPLTRRDYSPFHSLASLTRDCASDIATEYATVLFHHRLPTSTDNAPFLNHPIASRDSFLIHNGIISNAHDLKAKHEKKQKIRYQHVQSANRFNDSEALAHDLTIALEKITTTPRGKRHVVLHSLGSFAFVRYDQVTKKILYGRNSQNPLHETHLEDGTIVLASQACVDIAKLAEWSSHEIDKITELDLITGTFDTIIFHQKKETIRWYDWGKHYKDGKQYKQTGFVYESDGWESDYPPAMTQAACTIRGKEYGLVNPPPVSSYLPAKHRLQSALDETMRQ